MRSIEPTPGAQESATPIGRYRIRGVALSDRLVQRPVLSIFVLALVVRALLAVVVAVHWHGALFLDDAGYSRVAAAAARGELHDPYDSFVYQRTATLLVPITGLYKLFGPVAFLGELYVALLGATAAALTTRIAMEFLNRGWALVAGLMVALLPSQVLWSSLILKDAAVWATLSALALTIAVAGRSGGRRLLPLGIGAAVLLIPLGYLRLHTLEIACVAMLVTVILWPRPHPLGRLIAAAAVLAFMPLFFGMGIAGASFVQNSRNPGEQRELNALEAGSAVVTTPPPTAARATPAPDRTPSTSSNLAYLPTGLTVIALRPWPWESSSGSAGVNMARIEAIVWYPLLLLAAVGLLCAWPHRRVLAFPILTGGAILAVYGLSEGNLGTAYRHRGEVVWIVALLGTFGIERIVTWRRSRRALMTPQSAS